MTKDWGRRGLLLSLSSSTATNLAPNCCKSSFTLTQYGQYDLLPKKKNNQNTDSPLWYTKASRYIHRMMMLGNRNINIHTIKSIYANKYKLRFEDTNALTHNNHTKRTTREKINKWENREETEPENNDGVAGDGLFSLLHRHLSSSKF